MPIAVSSVSIRVAMGRSLTSSASWVMTFATLRWLCGVATMPCSVPSHSLTSAKSMGRSLSNRSAKAFWISWRASAAEQGQVLEYRISTPSSNVILPLASVPLTVTGYELQPALSDSSAI